MYMYVSNKIDIHNSTQLIYILKCTDTEMHTFIYHKFFLEFCWCWFSVYTVNHSKTGLYWSDFKCTQVIEADIVLCQYTGVYGANRFYGL